MNEVFLVPGCTVKAGKGECLRGCGGRLPYTSEQFTALILTGTINPEILCRRLTDNLESAKDIFGIAAVGVETESP